MRWSWIDFLAGFPGPGLHPSRWLDGDARAQLPPQRRQAVERHLARCPRCRTLAEAEAQARMALAALETVEPPPGLMEAILARTGMPTGVPSPATVASAPADRLEAGRAVVRPEPGAGIEPVTGPGAEQGDRHGGRHGPGRHRVPGRGPLPAVLAAAAMVALVLLAGRFGGTGDDPGGSRGIPPGWQGVPALETAGTSTGGPAVATDGHGPSDAGAVAANRGGVGEAAGAGGEGFGDGPGAAVGAVLADPAGRPAPGSRAGDAAAAGLLATVPGRDQQGQWLIRSGRLELTVPDVEPAFREAQAVAQRLGGFTEQAQLEGGGPTRFAYLVLRVPDDRLEEAMDRLAGLAGDGRVDLRALSAEDISQQWVDTQARLANLRAQEERLRQLAGRSGSVEDLLKVEQELWRVRGEIEQLEGQVRYWQQAMRLARIEVAIEALAPQPAPPAGDRFTRVRLAWQASLRSLATLATLALVGAAIVLPYAALAGAVVLAWRIGRRWRGR